VAQVPVMTACAASTDGGVELCEPGRAKLTPPVLPISATSKTAKAV